MSKLSAARAFDTRTRRSLTCVVIFAMGALVGGLLTWHANDPHTATAERLTGTVPWSNQETRLFAFEADGEQTEPLEGQTFYHVISDDLNFPNCLAGKPNDPVRQDRRRVELEAIHQDLGGQQQTHIAVSVCQAPGLVESWLAVFQGCGDRLGHRV